MIWDFDQNESDKPLISHDKPAYTVDTIQMNLPSALQISQHYVSSIFLIVKIVIIGRGSAKPSPKSRL